MARKPLEFTKSGLYSLKPQQLALWTEYMNNGFIKIDAFVKVNPTAIRRMASGEITDKNHFGKACFVAFQKIEESIGQDNLLEAFGLGRNRVMSELDKRLDSETTKYWQGESIGEHADNSTRMRATELLSKLNGMDKPAEESAGTGVQFYIPSNHRDDNFTQEDSNE